MNARLRAQQPAVHRVSGFTLIELLVVVSIISALIGITAPVIFKFLSRSEETRVRSVLNGLAAAADSYNITTGTVVDHRVNRDAFGNSVDCDIDGDDDDFTLGWFVVSAGQIPEAAQLIAIAAKDELFLDNMPMVNVTDLVTGRAGGGPGLGTGDISRIQFRDRWDTPIRYAGGVSHGDSFNDDDYLRAHPTAFFVSAGPDGLFGEVLEDNNQPNPAVDDDGDGRPDAEDNIYSFDLN